MTEKDQLDDLFEKARNENNKFNPEDPLSNAISQNKHPFSLWKKLAIGAVAAIILIVAYIGLDSDSKKDEFSVNQSSNANDSNARSAQSLQDSSKSASNPIGDESEFDFDDPNTINTQKTYVENQTAELESDQQSLPDNSKDTKNKFEEVVLKGDIEKLLDLQKTVALKHIIYPDKDTILVTESGTKYYFESHSFLDKNGQVTLKPVLLEIKECYDLNSIIRENLSTNNDGTLLETAGMFHINAMQGNDTCKIRKGYEFGISPNKEIPERMDLYYGDRNSTEDINWKVDPLGKKQIPIIIVTGGKYRKITDNYFYKNYRLDKPTMLNLIDTSWTCHFTTDNRKVIGLRSCRGEEGALLTACENFNDQMVYELAKMDIFNPNSRMTEFTFSCYSKNKYAYAMMKGNIDSVVTYTPPSKYNYLEVPLFFSINTGWLNLDCVPSINLKWKKRGLKPMNDVTITIPPDMKVNAFLYLNEQNSIARTVNTENGKVTFKDIPSGQNAKLIITSFIDDVFYVYSSDIVTDEAEGTRVKFSYIYDIDEYLKWIDANCKKEN